VVFPTPDAMSLQFDLAMNEDGAAVLAWCEDFPDYTPWVPGDVWVSLYASDTGWTDGELLGASISSPHVSISDEGIAMVIGQAVTDETWVPYPDDGEEQPITELWSARHVVGSDWAAIELVDPSRVAGFSPWRVAFQLDDAGNALAVWDAGSLRGQWWNRFTDADGWGVPVSLGESARSQISLAVHGTGDAIAVWHAYVQEEDASDAVQAVRFEADSAAWGSVEVLHRSLHNPNDLSVEMDAQGNALVHFRQDPESASPTRSSQNQVVWVNRFNPGAGWGQLESIGTAWLSHQLGMDGFGNVIAMWPLKDQHGLWEHRYSVESGWESPEMIVDATDLGFHLEVGSAGDAVILYSMIIEGYQSELWSMRYVPGVGWGAAELVDILSPYFERDIAIDGEGNAILAYGRQVSGGYEVVVRKSSRPE